MRTAEGAYTLEEIMAPPCSDKYHGPACPQCGSRFTKRGTFTDGTRYCMGCRKVFDMRSWLEHVWGKR